MRQYALKRIALIIPTVLLVSIIVFTVMRLLPGDPALVILSEGDASFTQEELEDLRRQLGTDRPIVVQYGDWIYGLVQGDLGTSIWRSGQPVTKLVGDPRVPHAGAGGAGNRDCRDFRRAIGDYLRYQNRTA